MSCNKVLACLLSASVVLAPAATFANLSSSNKTGIHGEVLFLQPNSDNLKYAVYVTGTQPFHQGWFNQAINPDYSPAFALGADYAIPNSNYSLSVDWLHFNASDSASKQASSSTDIATVEFIGPPYDVGPAVFGIKHASSKLNNNFNNVTLNFGKYFDYNANVVIHLFGGLDILSLNQTVTTTFNDMAGTPPVSTQAYPLPADPRFYFTTQNVSKYLGAGPDLGLNIKYEWRYGLGIVSQVVGSITAGTLSAQDNFTSASERLLLLGITTSRQNITTPNMTQVVPGVDAKFGVFLHRCWCNQVDFNVELGYRFAYFDNVIGKVNPQTLVQAGLNSLIPEFSTGTMAINSTGSGYSPFSLQGPYLAATVNMM